MAGHETAVQYLADRWLWIVFWLWILGGFSWAGERWRQVRRRAREAAGVRHRRRVELELARRGWPYQDPRTRQKSPPPGVIAWLPGSGQPPAVLPAAVIPVPPGAQPVSGFPGPCRHEKIVPVISDDGELHKWVCANYPRCDAEFDRSVALYEPGS